MKKLILLALIASSVVSANHRFDIKINLGSNCAVLVTAEGKSIEWLDARFIKENARSEALSVYTCQLRGNKLIERMENKSAPKL
jgi:hypothetical protein